MPTKKKRDRSGENNYTAAKKRFHATPKQKKRRAATNKARRAAVKAGKVKKGDGKDVDHKRPLSRGGSTSLSNTRVLSRSTNRARGAKLSSGNPKGIGGRKKKR